MEVDIATDSGSEGESALFGFCCYVHYYTLLTYIITYIHYVLRTLLVLKYHEETSTNYYYDA